MQVQNLLNSANLLLANNGTDYNLVSKQVTVDDENPAWNPLIVESTTPIKGVLSPYDSISIELGIAKAGDSKMVIIGQVDVNIGDYFVVGGKKLVVYEITSASLKNTDIVKILKIRNE